MKVAGTHFQAVFWEAADGGRVAWIDQCQLPHRFEIRRSRDAETVARAIEKMEVRGAPSIGAFAALGLALAYSNDHVHFESHWLPRFRGTRPTAVNLFHACQAMQDVTAGNPDARSVVEAAIAYTEAEIARNRRIGGHLAEALAVGRRRILTHCNAGWLAAVDWGTALSGIYELARQGERPRVLADETRPRLQGARLTAWELQQEGVECRIHADGAAAWLMAQGKVDAVVVGADRIAANGDVANKIGTYMLALAAREHGIPFYVAAPKSTFDAECASGREIHIEERAGEEVLRIQGADSGGNWRELDIAAAGVEARNPAFDVTPASLISGIISEEGVWRR